MLLYYHFWLTEKYYMELGLKYAKVSFDIVPLYYFILLHVWIKVKPISNVLKQNISQQFFLKLTLYFVQPRYSVQHINTTNLEFPALWCSCISTTNKNIFLLVKEYQLYIILAVALQERKCQQHEKCAFNNFHRSVSWMWGQVNKLKLTGILMTK